MYNPVRLLGAVLLLLLASAAPVLAQGRVSGPASAPVDSVIIVRASADAPAASFIGVVPKGAAEGSYDQYVYAAAGDLELRVPAEPGEYELRLLGPDSPYPTLHSQPIRLVAAEASLDAPGTAAITESLRIRWRGPSGTGEFITIVAEGAPEGEYEAYEYTVGEGAGEVSLTAPASPGRYEIRYLSGSRYATLASRPLQVGDVELALEFPAQASAGSQLEVRWVGPGNARDYITIVPPDAVDSESGAYAYTDRNPVSIRVPERAGRYEVRYLVADSARVLLRKPLEVGSVSASLQAPASVIADSEFEVRFEGPANESDYIAVTRTGDPADYFTWSYAKRGNPLPLMAPDQPGEYELHYLTGKDHVSLASRPIRVTPGNAKGRLRVTGGAADQAAAGRAGEALTVALILDASGSMLQRLDGRRRIELAREALDRLVSSGLPDAAQVALRVFGHRKPDACDTELLRPLAPLDRAAMRQQIAGIEAKNLARTPIADSLRAVSSDLEGVEGRAVVVLVTDGEETCGGDPAAEIARLKQQGFQLVLNVVGFAVDEHALEREFARWAELGGGAYFSARDGAALAQGLGQAVRMPFVVYRGNERVGAGFVGGAALELPVGSYEVEIGGRRQPVTLDADRETTLSAEG